MMMRMRALWDRMRGTYWAVPSAMATVAVVSAFIMIDVDQALTEELLNQLSWVYTGGAEGARAVLSTIAASMITVAGDPAPDSDFTSQPVSIETRRIPPRLASARSKLGEVTPELLADEVVLDVLVDLEATFPRAMRLLGGDGESALRRHLTARALTPGPAP